MTKDEIKARLNRIIEAMMDPRSDERWRRRYGCDLIRDLIRDLTEPAVGIRPGVTADAICGYVNVGGMAALENRPVPPAPYRAEADPPVVPETVGPTPGPAVQSASRNVAPQTNPRPRPAARPRG
jgi:hypothetical protein